jgi:dienelactone hydrolase
MRFLLALGAAAACVVFAPQARSAPDPAAAATVEIPLAHGKLRAFLFRPEGTGPFPAVIGLHACGGISNSRFPLLTRYRDWGQRLSRAGFVVLYPDSYGSRGMTSQCTVGRRAIRSNRERVADVSAARKWLQQQSWVAPDRISLLGWSNGGITTLAAVRPNAAAKDGGADFRSAVALYPGCRELLKTAWSARVPTLILIGRADDLAPAAACEQMVAGARGRSARTVIHVYPRAYHDFDHPNRPVQMRSGYAFSADGSGRVHTGTNPSARADALKRIPAWVGQ